MVVGAGLVFSGVIWMNTYSEGPAKQETEKTTAFNVEKKPPPPKPKRRRPKKVKRKMKSVRRAPAPAPDIAQAIGGASFGLEQFEVDLTSFAGDGVLGNTTNKLVMTADTVDKQASPVRRTNAVYPPAARKRGQEGFVVLNFLVQADGSVSGVRVLQSDPPGLFDQAAIEAVSQWQFNPAEYQGAPVSARVKQRMTFKLGG